jgi:glycogen(starch) synthase
MRILLKKTFDVLYYTPRFYPAIAGAEFYILNLAMKMHHDSRKILVLCSSAVDYKAIHNPNGLKITPNHPNYTSYKRIPILRASPEYSYDFQVFQDLLFASSFPLDIPVEDLLKIGPNHTRFMLNNFNQNLWETKIIHSAYLPYATILFASLYSRKMHIPSVCTPFFHISNPRYQNDKIIPILNLYDRVITCTNAESNYLSQKGISKTKLITIPMGVDYKLYEPSQKTRSGKLKSFTTAFSLQKPFVLYCGYKNYEKGAISVLKAARICSVDLAYVFIGPSTTAFDIELKKTRSLGIKVYNITPDNLNGYYDWRKISAFQECEFFVMPSRSDAYGIAYLEAWASKKAVIGADTAVMKEVIQHNKDGLLVEFDNPPLLANAIQYLFENRQKSNEMGLVGYYKVKKNNTWDIIYKKTMDVYNQLIN